MNKGFFGHKTTTRDTGKMAMGEGKDLSDVAKEWLIRRQEMSRISGTSRA